MPSSLPLAHHTLQRRLESPLGPITLARSQRGLSGLWFEGQAHHPGPLAAPQDEGQDPVLAAASAALLLACEGRWSRQALPPLDPKGTAFQRAVWQALLEIPSGQLQSYGALALRLGRPSAARAVGAAVGRNPISVLIPCHRVVGARGALTGYAGGLQRKQALLNREGA
jgi:methylated-DNA-[protein]-cysteine S-methyltransferase